MDFSEFLIPVPYELRYKEYMPFSAFQKIKFEIDEELDSNAIVLIALDENELGIDSQNEGLNLLRDSFYSLSVSNWKHSVYDLGTLPKGATFEDTCFALHQVTHELSQTGASIIILGGSQAYNYILYKSLQRDLLKVGTIDIKIDIEGNSQELNANNHITKMIFDETHRLLEYKNIGSQAAYVAKEELDILEQLNFEDLRLGKLIDDIKLAEPMLRELDLLSIDMNVMQYSSFSNAIKLTPNGLNEREICGLMKYAGLSPKMNLLHISNFDSSMPSPSLNLLAEMLWYFVEAKNNHSSNEITETYRVQSTEGEIVFLYSQGSDRWWIEVEVEEGRNMIPCNESDYTDAMKGEIPDNWLKFFKKFY